MKEHFQFLIRAVLCYAGADPEISEWGPFERGGGGGGHLTESGVF